MKVDMILELKDVPGSLIRALDPISSHGGNIISVLHSRGEKDSVSVQVAFRVHDQSSLDLIRKSLKEGKVKISDIKLEGKKYYSKKTISFILVGHVIDTDIRDTIDRINTVGLVSGIDVVMPSPEERSSVIMNVNVDEKKIDELLKLINKVCDEKEFLLIRSLN